MTANFIGSVSRTSKQNTVLPMYIGRNRCLLPCWNLKDIELSQQKWIV